MIRRTFETIPAPGPTARGAMPKPARRLAARVGTVLVLILALLAAPAVAQAPKAAPPDEQSPRVRLLLDLLADEEVKSWVERQRAAEKAKPPAAGSDGGLSKSLATRIDSVQHEIGGLMAALPTVPSELGRAAQKLHSDMGGSGALRALLLILGFVAIGVLAEWLFVRVARGALPVTVVGEPRSVRERLRSIGLRLVSGMLRVAAFAAGSIGVFLIFTWPPLLREVVAAYLAAFIALRVVIVATNLLFAPDCGPLRIIPLPTRSAIYWRQRLLLLIGWFAFGFATVDIVRTLGVSFPTLRLFAMTLAIGLLLIAIEMVWRRPVAPQDATGLQPTAWFGGYRASLALSLLFLVLWAVRLIGAFPLFWLLAVAASVPAAIRITRRSVEHLLRPPPDATEALVVPSLYRVGIERGLRAAWIVGGVLLLAHTWDVDLVEMTARDSVATRLLRGALSAIVIVLVADFGWQLLRALIDDRLAAALQPGQPDTDEARRRARLRTLLPIVKNILFIVFIVMSVLMALAALGVEIGPLIAGAGVVGVAVGFGAQTIVRDIISGMFYLLDDAFRIGEYIQSGSYKGTVESFSLRSVKLRHQRGALYTVPFGTLGAIQNMSRDWTIDKTMIGITYDSDLDLVKKLIKKVGKELQEIPEFAPSIIETLKMQGVEQFGDYAIQIRLKMMTRPGEQFMIRRRAFAMIKKAFDENGVKFAFPTVQVAGGETAGAAAAQAALQAAKPEPLAAG